MELDLFYWLLKIFLYATPKMIINERLYRPELIKTRTLRKSDNTPALALSKHMASVFDEKCREKEKGELNRRKPVLNPTVQQVTVN